MRTLEFKNFADMSLAQWVPIITADLSEGKKAEDAMIYPEIAKLLREIKAQYVVDIIADEGRLTSYIAKNVTTIAMATHLTIREGGFSRVATQNLFSELTQVRQHFEEDLGEDADAAKLTPKVNSTIRYPKLEGKQDAVVLNMIVGSLAAPGFYDNIDYLFERAGEFLKPNGKLFIVSPNPECGTAPTYQCLTPKEDLRAGQNYDFKVNGIEDTLQCVHTPTSFLAQRLAPQFTLKAERPIGANDLADASFVVTVFEKIRNVAA